MRKYKKSILIILDYVAYPGRFWNALKDCTISLHHDQTNPWHDRGGAWLSVAHGTLAAPNLHRLKPVLLSRCTQKHPQRCPEDRAALKALRARLAHILAPSRWRLRRAIAAMNQQLEALGLTQHPDKTTIGPLARGFDFLGYQFDPAGLSLSGVTRSRYQEKLTRLYERYHRQLRAYRSGWIGRSTILRPLDRAQAYLNPGPSITSHDDITRLLEAYQRRFIAWPKEG